jgi:prevent-host-death family protein
MPWQVQEAKQRLSEVLRAARRGEPQVITRHGEEVAVVIDIASYRRLAGVQVELADYLRHGPTFDDLDLRRIDDRPRDVDIADPAPVRP